MTARVAFDRLSPTATDGEITAINLESARRCAWARFTRDPGRPGIAEEILDHECLLVGFLGDFGALDRIDSLASIFAQADTTFRAALLHAAVASTVHRFEDARAHLARAAEMGGAPAVIERHTLAIDQACGMRLDRALETRRRLAALSGSLEDLIPLGALLADLEHFEEAAETYQDGLYAYGGTSPFPLAWVCFQLGELWGELVSEPSPSVAALWYERAISYFPSYVRARVHLAETYMRQARSADAASILLPLLSSHDPEVPWRLAEALLAQGRPEEAELHLNAARRGFGELVRRHPLAFADHAAEFYAGSGGDCARALQLARLNVANRPTRRAVQQAQEIATQSAALRGTGYRDEAVSG
jgi:tetratricopeptide (TPR) repeat protein